MATARVPNLSLIPNPTTGGQIRLRRLGLHLSQTEFVERYNSFTRNGAPRLTGPLLSHIETGIVIPSTGLAARIARVFEILERRKP